MSDSKHDIDKIVWIIIVAVFFVAGWGGLIYKMTVDRQNKKYENCTEQNQ